MKKKLILLCLSLLLVFTAIATACGPDSDISASESASESISESVGESSSDSTHSSEAESSSSASSSFRPENPDESGMEIDDKRTMRQKFTASVAAIGCNYTNFYADTQTKEESENGFGTIYVTESWCYNVITEEGYYTYNNSYYYFKNNTGTKVYLTDDNRKGSAAQYTAKYTISNVIDTNKFEYTHSEDMGEGETYYYFETTDSYITNTLGAYFNYYNITKIEAFLNADYDFVGYYLYQGASTVVVNWIMDVGQWGEDFSDIAADGVEYGVPRNEEAEADLAAAIEVLGCNFTASSRDYYDTFQTYVTETQLFNDYNGDGFEGYYVYNGNTYEYCYEHLIAGGGRYYISADTYVGAASLYSDIFNLNNSFAPAKFTYYGLSGTQRDTQRYPMFISYDDHALTFAEQITEHAADYIIAFMDASAIGGVRFNVYSASSGMLAMVTFSSIGTTVIPEGPDSIYVKSEYSTETDHGDFSAFVGEWKITQIMEGADYSSNPELVSLNDVLKIDESDVLTYNQKTYTFVAEAQDGIRQYSNASANFLVMVDGASMVAVYSESQYEYVMFVASAVQESAEWGGNYSVTYIYNGKVYETKVGRYALLDTFYSGDGYAVIDGKVYSVWVNPATGVAETGEEYYVCTEEEYIAGYNIALMDFAAMSNLGAQGDDPDTIWYYSKDADLMQLFANITFVGSGKCDHMYFMVGADGSIGFVIMDVNGSIIAQGTVSTDGVDDYCGLTQVDFDGTVFDIG